LMPMNSSIFKPIDEKRTISEKIVDQITKLVVTGNLKVGDKLPPERELAEMLGVGRSSLREALRSMINMGLLAVKHSEGTYIKKADANSLKPYFQWNIMLENSTLDDLIEARELIELNVVTKAAERRTSEDMRKLEETIKNMKENTDDRKTLVDYDIEFHRMLVEIAGNSIMLSMIEIIRSAMEVWFSYVLSYTKNVTDTIEEHTAIMNAVGTGDGEKARMLLKDHLVKGASRLHYAINDVTATAGPGI